MTKRRPGGGAGLTHVDQPVSQQLPQPPGAGVGGSDHRQVAVQADEGQDQDAAVQVHRVDNMDADAGGRSGAPVGQGRVHGPEGQRQDEEEVSGGQVEAVPVGEAGLGPGEDHRIISRFSWGEKTQRGRSGRRLTCAGSPAPGPPGRSR